jgi:hypothetical protein
MAATGTFDDKVKFSEGRLIISFKKTFSLTMGNRDTRYDLIEPMMSQGKIVSFTDVFKYIKKTVVAIDLGKKVDRFTVMMHDPKKFSVGDIYKMSDLFKISPRRVFDLIDHEYLQKHEHEK